MNRHVMGNPIRDEAGQYGRRCKDGYHVSHGGVSRSCYCGKQSNPAYRSPFNRWRDRWRMQRRKRAAAKR